MARRKPALTATVSKGDLRASLEALRDHLATEIENGVLCRSCGGPASSPTAPLAKQLADVLKALDAMPSSSERTIDDDLADIRRRKAADVADGAVGQGRVAGRGSRRPSGTGGPRSR